MVELPESLRVAIERNIDTILEDPETLETYLNMLEMSEIELTEDTLAAFVYGIVMSFAYILIPRTEGRELTGKDIEEVVKLMRRRRREIVDALWKAQNK